jgi:type II secretory pathway component PulC
VNLPRVVAAAHSWDVRALCVVLCLVACGGSAPEPRPVEKQPPAPVAAPAPPAPRGNPGTLKRAEVVAFVNAGFWNFLQQVEVEPSLAEGRFRGWLIVALRPPAFWQGVDLAPGDVVTAVNDLPIERETEAFDAFQSLKTAPALNVAYVRSGAPRRIAYRIAD